MAVNMHMEIVTPEKVLWRGDVASVTAPGFSGEFGVLPDHAPFMTSLKIGVLHFREEGGEDKWAAIHGGYFEILDNRITVLAQHAELAHEIDLDRALRARGRAEARLKEFANLSQEDKDVIHAMAALDRALTRETAVSRLK